MSTCHRFRLRTHTRPTPSPRAVMQTGCKNARASSRLRVDRVARGRWPLVPSGANGKWFVMRLSRRYPAALRSVPCRSPPRPSSGCTRGPSAVHGHGAAMAKIWILCKTGGVRSGRRQRDSEGDLDRLGVKNKCRWSAGCGRPSRWREKELSELGNYCISRNI